MTLPMPLAASVAGEERRVADPRARSFFRRATIKTRLAIAFLGLAGLSLIGTFLAIFQLHAMQQLTLQDLRAARASGELHAAVAANVVRATALSRASDPAVFELLLSGYKATDKTLDRLHDALSASSRSGQAKALLQQAAARREAFRGAVRSTLPEGPAMQPRAADLESAAAAYAASVRALADFHGAAQGDGETLLQGRAAHASRDLLLLFAVLCVLTLPVVVALFVHILRPMHGAMRIARKVADGD
ncbi:MAG TPA: hypothetical protein VGF26_26845, partial [Ramlibacter sp.]